MKPTRQAAESASDTDAAIATVLAELEDAGLVTVRADADGAVHFALTAAGLPVARQMAMSDGQHAIALLGVLMGSIERSN
jgi:hypothetical protein